MSDFQDSINNLNLSKQLILLDMLVKDIKSKSDPSVHHLIDNVVALAETIGEAE